MSEKVIYEGVLMEAEVFRSQPGGPLTYVIEGQYIHESFITLPSADIINGVVPPAPFTEPEHPFAPAAESGDDAAPAGGGNLSAPVPDLKKAARTKK
jgi:hypothetical protein